MTWPEDGLPWTDCPTTEPWAEGSASVEQELLDGCPGCHGCTRKRGHRCHLSGELLACCTGRPDDPLEREP